MGLDINIVIGANYGDEGKGLVTNALKKDKNDGNKKSFFNWIKNV